MVKEAIGWKGKTMKGLEEILEVPGAGEKCLKILVVGEPINIFIFKIFFPFIYYISKRNTDAQIARMHSIRMRTTRLPTVTVLV